MFDFNKRHLILIMIYNYLRIYGENERNTQKQLLEVYI